MFQAWGVACSGEQTAESLTDSRRFEIGAAKTCYLGLKVVGGNPVDVRV